MSAPEPPNGILLGSMRACVIGAGTMGAGIAAHIANLGYEVLLLDVTADAAKNLLERATKARPPHFYGNEAISRVTTGGIDVDLPKVAECDWICEAIIENLDAKRDLYQKLLPYLKPDAMISSNTSSLPLGLLAEGFPDTFRMRFLGTHFFNPPRYLKLLELIPTEDTLPHEVEKQTKFLEGQLGRRVVLAKDTPGFIANRFGMWSMFHAIHTAEKLGLSCEQVDAVCGPFLGRPRSAAFRLNDLVGADVMQFIAGIMHERCPNDPYRGTLETPESLKFLLEKGWLGNKSGQGYYRREGKSFLVLDLKTYAYRNTLDAEFDSIAAVAKKPIGERIRTVLASKDEAGEFLREHLVPVLQYAQYLKEEISHTVQDFDRVMMWGFGWEIGPFALIDAIGAEHLGIQTEKFYAPGAILGHSGQYEPAKNEPEYRGLTEYSVLEEQPGFNVRDLGDGVRAICTTTKMGVITPELVQSLLSWLPSQTGPMVFTSEARAFSVGYNLNFFAERAEAKDWNAIDAGLKDLQDLTVLLSEKQIIAAVFGHCLGAGFEIATACSNIICHPESNIGLPEALVGLLPGGAGTCRMRLRYQTSLQDLTNGLKTIASGETSGFGYAALQKGFLRPTDSIASHPDRVIWDAKMMALTAEPRSMPTWKQMEGPLSGMIDRMIDEEMKAERFSNHDAAIAHKMKQVFTKPTSFEEALAIERQEFIELTQSALSVARIRHMLDSGKPLRN